MIVSPRQLNADVSLDLETICLKCLEKIPARRYASAADLGDDLDRYLNGKPIAARPTGSWERTVKWARRRPAIAALSALSSLMAIRLVLGGVIDSLQLRAHSGKLEKQRDAARTAEATATKQRDTAQRLFQRGRRSVYALQLTLADILSEADPERGLAPRG